MIVGLTFDIREEYLKQGYSQEETAELDSPVTIGSIQNAIKSAGHEVIQIGSVKNLIKAISKGYRWDIVFNISEGIRGQGREALVPALLDHYGIPYTFSCPLTMVTTLDKPTAKIIARNEGVPTPEYFVVSKGENIKKKAEKMKFPLFVKPAAEGSGKGISENSIVHSVVDLEKECSSLWRVFDQPLLVETFLHGREYTTALIENDDGIEIIGTAEVIYNENAEGEVYSLSNKEKYETRIRYEIVNGRKSEECAELSKAIWRAFSCRDCARVDFREDENGKVEFLEINPLPGLNPLRSDLPIIASLVDLGYNELILKILQSALKRLKKDKV
ncbi:ATP-grasp domain-containing protein [candidate division WOR-3 bacterium]|nr:ATP-grasp domain-containing protein [candidate division WOR-3 bacterium]